jgi:hypothetical protein
MRLPSSRGFRLSLALGLAAVAAWSGWVYRQAKPHDLVTHSAVRNYTAAVADRSAEPPAAPIDGYVLWNNLSPDQRSVLAPLEKRWDFLSVNQRRSLIEAARRYPSLSEEQQIRFNARLVQWTQLTGKERRETRERYKALNALAPEQREQVKRSWYEGHGEPGADEGPPDDGLRRS